ncbi:MAG: hypothetical protein M3Y60_07095 [Bacteroidota bacterium]|nr:hypothetical protein [Bacteroidota bacterium]
MRKLAVILCLIMSAACNDDDATRYTSIDGYWVVRTPDDDTDVTFQVGRDADNQFIVQSVSVHHNGTDYNNKETDAEITVLSEREVESITFVTTVPQIPFYVIRFQGISLNSDFTEMLISNSSFQIDGVFDEFAMITATRE